MTGRPKGLPVVLHKRSENSKIYVHMSSFYNFLRYDIGFYTIAAAVGLIVAFIVYFKLARRRDLPVSQIVYTYLYAILGVFLGGHLMFFIVGLPGWIEHYRGSILTVGDFISAFGQGASGMVFYGGLLGALLMIFIFCRTHGFMLRPELNNAVVVFPLFHFFGRVGCTLTGCCYGIEYHGLFNIHYTPDYINPGLSDDIADFSRFPVQPLEALIELAVFVALLIIYLKTENRYSITCIYLTAYSIVRFLDEFLRGDNVRGLWGPLSTSQWISLAILIVTVIYLIVKKTKNQPVYTG